MVSQKPQFFKEIGIKSALPDGLFAPLAILTPKLCLTYTFFHRENAKAGPENAVKSRKTVKMEQKGNIYVCHTFYHAFVAFLKELNLPKEERGHSALVLSSISNDFEDLADRVRKGNVFAAAYEFDEKKDDFFPELAKYKIDHGNILANMRSRIIYTRKFAKLQEAYVPVDFRKYKDIYVFCDQDPIGIYLNQHRIHYHAMEDGLNYLKPFIPAKFDNRGHFGLKKFFSMNLNLIFIRDGYSKYCLDMEVNDLSVVDDEYYKYKEVPRKALVDNLDAAGKAEIVKTFISNYDRLVSVVGQKESGRKSIVILTEPLCTFDVRERIFRDLIDKYSKEGQVFLKPHPRDDLSYKTLFPEVTVFERSIPMEVFNFLDEVKFDKVVSVFTPLDFVHFANEKESLGEDFMDRYEDPSVHRKKEIMEAEAKK